VAKRVVPLSEVKIRTARPMERAYKLTDGDGLVNKLAIRQLTNWSWIIATLKT
jgi:hypothetical protein